MALEQARGAVLDVGAGVGRHTLVLQQRGLTVTAIDTELDLVLIMKERGVVDARTESVLALQGETFDTILMLMNGFGLVGTPAGGAKFLAHARGLLAPGGQILCDSLDVRATKNARHLAYQLENLGAGRPAGQMRFWIEYDGKRGAAFDWLHFDFDALREMAEKEDWRAEMLGRDEDGHYLARLSER